MKGKALLFGLNYNHCKQGKLKGCINDVFNMAKYIHSLLDIPIELYTDDTDIKSTSYDGIISILHNLAIESYKNDLDFVWIHFSGHGSQQKDTSGDEKDGMDEGLVPSDYEKKGIIIDDIIHKTICSFNPKTKILFICDSCHSGTMLDLKYTWSSDKQCTIDNKNNSIKSNTMLISGCMDEQTSADAFNLLNDNKSVGALSATILKVLTKKPEKIYNAFSLINSVRNELRRGGYSQIPSLSTNFDISENSSLIPLNKQIKPIDGSNNITQEVNEQSSSIYPQQQYYVQSSSVKPQQQYYVQSSSVKPQQQYYVQSSSVKPQQQYYVQSSSVKPQQQYYVQSSSVKPQQQYYVQSPSVQSQEYQQMAQQQLAQQQLAQQQMAQQQMAQQQLAQQQLAQQHYIMSTPRFNHV